MIRLIFILGLCIFFIGVFSQNADAHRITLIENTGSPADSVLTIGTDGFPVIAYHDFTSPGELKIVHCTSIDCASKDTPTTLDSVGFTGSRPAITIGTDGFPIISYLASSQNSAMKIVHCTSVNCSTFDTPRTIDGGPTRSDSSIIIGTDNFPVISYADGSPVSKLQFVHCTNVNCSTFDATKTLDSDSSVGTSSRVKIGTDGFPIISYNVINNAGLGILHCTSIDCSTFSAPQKLENIVTNSLEVDMTIGIDGFPILSYNEGALREQRVLHCTNIDCSTFDGPFIIDGGGSSPFSDSISIAISNDGFPLVVYVSDSPNNLTLVNCLTINCSISSDPINFDTNAGFPTSTAVGADGFPVISYSSLGDIKLVHCQDVNCDLFDNIPQFITTLEGSQEVPPVSTTASGFAEFALNEPGDEMAFIISLTNLDIDGIKTGSVSDDVTGAHIHRAPSGVNGEIVVGFIGPDTVSEDIHPVIFDPDLDLLFGTIKADGLSGTLTAQPLSSLVNEMISGNTYVNIHTIANSGGEIRGQIEPCLPPSSGNWIVEFDCTLINDSVAPANVIVQNNSVLVIPDGIMLTVPSGFNITVLSGGGILIEFGGTVIVVS